MCRIPRDIDAAHPRIDKVRMSLILVGDRHHINEGIIVERAAFDTVKGDQAL